MKIFMINSVCGTGSTGRICTDLAERLEADGHDCRIAYGRRAVPERYRKYAVKIGGKSDVYVHGAQARLFDSVGFGSKHATKMLIEKIKTYDPDVIHLHNLHGYYINIETLFSYLEEANKPVVWTLHDCWAFTGHCVHYDAIGCQKWKDGCHHCSLKKSYPSSVLMDRSAANYQKKKALFHLPDDMTLITPSGWLADQVRQSFLGDRPVQTIYNGIDRAVFHNTPSDVKSRYGRKNIALGIANIWDERKGLAYMIQLSKLLDQSWTVVLIGLTHKQIEALPPDVVGIQRTDDLRELAAWYSAADVYVNASSEETMGMTTAEAISCGTPVAAFDTTAVSEIVGQNGIAVPYGDVKALSKAVERIAKKGKASFQNENSRFALENEYRAYLKLYEQRCGQENAEELTAVK